MTAKDVAAYANKRWVFYRKTAEKLSEDDPGIPLVDNKTLMYCFDDIVGSLFSKNKPASVDVLHIMKDRTILLIEFKRGFDRVFLRDNEESGKNDQNKLKKKELAELRTSLQMKAVESYIVLEKRIFPLCDDCEKKRRLRYWVVVDIPPINTTGAILESLALKKNSQSNPFANLEQSLRRFRSQRDALNQDYFYDEIKVISFQEFSKYLT